jgi:hypothetical protein
MMCSVKQQTDYAKNLFTFEIKLLYVSMYTPVCDVIYVHKNTTEFPGPIFTIRAKLFFFYIHGSVHRNNIPLYIQQDVTLHSLFYLETALHVSVGTITHNQERKQLYLQHLVFVTPLLLFIYSTIHRIMICLLRPSAIPVDLLG